MTPAVKECRPELIWEVLSETNVLLYSGSSIDIHLMQFFDIPCMKNLNCGIKPWSSNLHWIKHSRLTIFHTKVLASGSLPRVQTRVQTEKSIFFTNVGIENCLKGDILTRNREKNGPGNLVTLYKTILTVSGTGGGSFELGIKLK